MSKYTKLIEFWSDEKNVENAASENIQSDILAYLNWLVSAEKKSEQLERQLEAINQALKDVKGEPSLTSEGLIAWLYSTLPFLEEE